MFNGWQRFNEKVSIGASWRRLTWDRQACPHCRSTDETRSRAWGWHFDKNYEPGLNEWRHRCNDCDLTWDSGLPIFIQGPPELIRHRRNCACGECERYLPGSGTAVWTKIPTNFLNQSLPPKQWRHHNPRPHYV